MRVRVATATLALLAMANGSRALADAADYFRGKQVTIVTNYTAGGPTDTEARLIAKHLTKHIPGSPVVIVKNMGGAGGLIGINWLGQIAPQDGFTIGYVTGLAGAAAHDTGGLKVDPTKFGFIAGVEGITVVYARTDLGGGLRRPEDLLSKQDFWMGGLNPDSDKDLRLRAELDLLGLRYKYISGYAGAAEARLALERGEIQLSAESMPTYRVSIEPGLVRSGAAIPLWYDVSDGLRPHPDAAGIAAMPYEMFFQNMRGSLPSGTLWDALVLLKDLGALFQRAVIAPPNVPTDVLGVLRTAMAETAEDPEYQSDARATIQYVPRYPMGDQAEKLFRSKLNPDPRLQAFVAAYIEDGKKMLGK